MRRASRIAAVAGALLVWAAGPSGLGPSRLDAQETEKVLGIFGSHCVECHGPSKQSAQLRLDSLDALFKGGKSGPPIVAGKSKESLLYLRVSAAEPKKRMPPKGDSLATGEIETIEKWIDSGARAAPAASGGEGAREIVVPRADRLPATFAPVFCLAGDPARPRLAVGRGAAVDVYEFSASGTAEKPGLEAKRVKTLEGHSDIVQCVAFSANGNRLASGEFGVVRIWNAESWELVRELKPHADRVLAVAFNPDGKRIAAAGGLPTESGEVKVWDIENGREIWSVAPHSDAVLGIAWSGDGKVIATGAADRVTYILDAESGKVLRRLEAHTHHVLAVALSPDGKRAVTAGADRVLKLWDLEKGELVKNARGSEKPVTSVAFYDGGNRFASTGGDGQARFWDWENGKERFNLGEAKGYLQAGAFLAGDKYYATAEQDGALRLYDPAKRALLFKS